MKNKKQRPLSDLARFAISLDEKTDAVALKREFGKVESKNVN